MHSLAKVWLTNSGEAQDSITGSGWVNAEGMETIVHEADCVFIMRHWFRFSLNGYIYCWWTHIWSGLWKALIRHRKKNHSVWPIHLWLCDMCTLILSLCSSLFFITGLGSGQSVSLLGESGEMLTVLCFSTMVFSLCPSQSLVRSGHSRMVSSILHYPSLLSYHSSGYCQRGPLPFSAVILISSCIKSDNGTWTQWVPMLD